MLPSVSRAHLNDKFRVSDPYHLNLSVSFTYIKCQNMRNLANTLRVFLWFQPRTTPETAPWGSVLAALA